jgi:Putative amidoligase enzyme
VIPTNTTCGTHVHLSPRSASWSLEDLQKLSCCVLYFERAFEVLYPEAYRDPYTLPDVISWRKVYTKNAGKNKRAKHAKANWVDNRRFGVQYATNVDLICGTKDIPALIGLMNPLQEDYNRKDQYDRTFAWNFKNLLSGGSGTVEYRRPPGVQNANACIYWVRLAIAFVKAAMQVGDPRYPLQDDSSDAPHMHVHYLQRFLETGLPVGHTMADYFGLFFTIKGEV